MVLITDLLHDDDENVEIWYVLDHTVEYSTVQCSTVLYSTVKYSKVK